MASKVKELASKIIRSGSSQSSSKTEPTSTAQAQSSSAQTSKSTSIANMGDLPKEYKVAVFESKGAPLTFKSVPLKQPEDGQVRQIDSCAISTYQVRYSSKSWPVASATLMQPCNQAHLEIASQSSLATS